MRSQSLHHAARLAIVLCSASAFSLGCADRTKFHEMHDGTNQMNHTTKSMDDKVGKTNDKMEGMSKTMTGMDSKLGETKTLMTGMNGTMRDMNGSLGETKTIMTDMNGTMRGMDGKLADTKGLMTDMNGRITGMADTTEVMSENLSGMKDLTVSLDSKTGKLLGLARSAYIRGRQGSARDLRDKEFDGALKAETIDGKLTHASAYYMAMEYQLTDDKNIDTPELRDTIMAHNLEEFLFKMVDLIPRDRSLPICELYGMKLPGLKEADNTMKTGYIFTAAMHTINYDSAVLFKEQNLEIYSIVDLIKMAFQAQKKIDDSTDRDVLNQTPKVLHKILANREQAAFLMQMRLNVLVSILVAKLSAIDKAGLPEFLKGLSQQSMILSWNANLAALNTSRAQELTKVANWAIEAYDILAKDGGVNPRINAVLGIAFKNMKTPDAKPVAGMKNIDAARAELGIKIRELQARVSSNTTAYACPADLPSGLSGLLAGLACMP